MSQYSGMSVADVLARGEWTELQDASSNRKYYFNKNTRKTTWDLVKELGLSSPSGGSSSNVTPSAAREIRSIADALSFGGWTERLDPGSKKTYYVHQATKRTVWDLEKELGLASTVAVTPSRGSSAAGLGSPSSAPPSSATKKPAASVTSASDALASGEWVKQQDGAGNTYFRNMRTNEVTGNLELYLAIMAAVGDDPIGSPAQPIITSSRAAPPVEPQGSSAAAADASRQQVEDLDDYVALVLNAPGAKDATKRLLRKQLHSDGRLDPMLRAQDKLLIEQDRNSKLSESLRTANEVVQRLREEVHQLQCALFYGLGTTARGYNPPGTHSTTSNTRGGGSGTRRSGDIDDAPSTSNSREEYLERALHLVQEHNRQLVAELEQERTSKHFHATCGSCLSLDPWQRLIKNTIGTETSIRRKQ